MKLSAVGVSSKKRLNTAWRVRWIVSCLSLTVQRTLQLETGEKLLYRNDEAQNFGEYMITSCLDAL